MITLIVIGTVIVVALAAACIFWPPFRKTFTFCVTIRKKRVNLFFLCLISLAFLVATVVGLETFVVALDLDSGPYGRLATAFVLSAILTILLLMYAPPFQENKLIRRLAAVWAMISGLGFLIVLGIWSPDVPTSVVTWTFVALGFLFILLLILAPIVAWAANKEKTRKTLAHWFHVLSIPMGKFVLVSVVIYFLFKLKNRYSPRLSAWIQEKEWSFLGENYEGISWGVSVLIILLALLFLWRWIARQSIIPWGFGLGLGSTAKRMAAGFGVLVVVTALNAMLWWLSPDTWLEARERHIFWIVQAFGFFVTWFVVTKARRLKLLTATLAGLLFLGMAWLAVAYGPGELAPKIREVHWNFPRSAESPSSPEPQPEPIAVGTVSWVMPKGVEGKYKKERSSENRVEILLLDEEVFHYVTFCRHTGRQLTNCYWERKTSERGRWRTVDFNRGDEEREGDWFLIQDPDNPLLYQGAWSGPVSSGGKDVPYKLVIDP